MFSFKSLFSSSLDLILPHICPACEQPVSARGLLCTACFPRLTQIAEPLCRCCGVPFESREQANRQGFCPHCEAEHPAFHRARSVFLYDDASKNLVLPLKHADRTDLAASLAPFLQRAGREFWPECDLILPVPLHRSRLIERRFNQSALLARRLGRLVGRKVLADGLVRIKRTRPLGDLGRAERAEELDGSVIVNPRWQNAFRGKHIVVVDDVMTSGATVQACALALRGAGAAKIDAVAVARATLHS